MNFATPPPDPDPSDALASVLLTAAFNFNEEHMPAGAEYAEFSPHHQMVKVTGCGIVHIYTLEALGLPPLRIPTDPNQETP